METIGGGWSRAMFFALKTEGWLFCHCRHPWLAQLLTSLCSLLVALSLCQDSCLELVDKQRRLSLLSRMRHNDFSTVYQLFEIDLVNSSQTPGQTKALLRHF